MSVADLNTPAVAEAIKNAVEHKDDVQKVEVFRQ